jgi:hypothetical protein
MICRASAAAGGGSRRGIRRSGRALLGFAPTRPEDAADAMRRLAASIDAARTAPRRGEPVAVRLVRA